MSGTTNKGIGGSAEGGKGIAGPPAVPVNADETVVFVN